MSKTAIGHQATQNGHNDCHTAALFRSPDFHYLQGDIFGAGMDTTANTLKYVMLYLCQHPQWQVKLRQEAIAAGKSHLMKAFVCEVCRKAFNQKTRGATNKKTKCKTNKNKTTE